MIERSGWISLQPNKSYRFCNYGNQNSKFFEFGIAISNWQGASFFKLYIASSFMTDGSDIKTGIEGAVGSGVNIYRSGLSFYISLGSQVSESKIKLLSSVTIGAVTADTSVIESTIPDGATQIL